MNWPQEDVDTFEERFEDLYIKATEANVGALIGYQNLPPIAAAGANQNAIDAANQAIIDAMALVANQVRAPIMTDAQRMNTFIQAMPESWKSEIARICLF